MWDRVIHWTWSPLIPVGCLSSELQDSVCLHRLSTRPHMNISAHSLCVSAGDPNSRPSPYATSTLLTKPAQKAHYFSQSRHTWDLILWFFSFVKLRSWILDNNVNIYGHSSLTIHLGVSSHSVSSQVETLRKQWLPPHSTPLYPHLDLDSWQSHPHLNKGQKVRDRGGRDHQWAGSLGWSLSPPVALHLYKRTSNFCHHGWHFLLSHPR